MTNQNNAAQPLLTDEEIQDIADGFDIYGAKPEFARAIESALLSKLASAPVAGEARPTDDDILVLALDHGAISGGQHFGPAIRFARALLSQYAAPQASEAK